MDWVLINQDHTSQDHFCSISCRVSYQKLGLMPTMMMRWDVCLWAWNRLWDYPRGALREPLMTVPQRHYWRIGWGRRFSEWFYSTTRKSNLSAASLSDWLRSNMSKRSSVSEESTHCVALWHLPIHGTTYQLIAVHKISRMHIITVHD